MIYQKVSEIELTHMFIIFMTQSVKNLKATVTLKVNKSYFWGKTDKNADQHGAAT